MKYQIIEGDLIKLSLEGMFNIIGHCVNAFQTQKSGIAKQMVEYFNTDLFKEEVWGIKGDIRKLGNIDVEPKYIKGFKLYVINMYAQYYYGNKPKEEYWYPLDYEALSLCLRKINHNSNFKGKHIGLPYKLGSGLAGGDWKKVEEIIKRELFNLDVTIVKII